MNPTNSLKSFKGISEEEVRISNRYYSQYGSEYSVENLAWLNDRILNTYEEPLRNKILKGMVGVNMMEMGGNLVLKLMLEIIMDINNSALRALTQSLQTLRLNYVPSENVCTTVSYSRVTSSFYKIVRVLRLIRWASSTTRWDLHIVTSSVD